MASQHQQASQGLTSHAIDSPLLTSYENSPVSSDCDDSPRATATPTSTVKFPPPPSPTANLLTELVAVLGSEADITLPEGSTGFRTVQFAPLKPTPPHSMKPAAAPDSSKLNALSSSSSLHGSLSSGGGSGGISMAGSMTRRSLVSINCERSNRSSSSSSALFSRRGSSGSSSGSSSVSGSASTPPHSTQPAAAEVATRPQEDVVQSQPLPISMLKEPTPLRSLQFAPLPVKQPRLKPAAAPYSVYSSPWFYWGVVDYCLTNPSSPYSYSAGSSSGSKYGILDSSNSSGNNGGSNGGSLDSSSNGSDAYLADIVAGLSAEGTLPLRAIQPFRASSLRLKYANIPVSTGLVTGSTKPPVALTSFSLNSKSGGSSSSSYGGSSGGSSCERPNRRSSSTTEGSSSAYGSNGGSNGSSVGSSRRSTLGGALGATTPTPTVQDSIGAVVAPKPMKVVTLHPLAAARRAARQAYMQAHMLSDSIALTAPDGSNFDAYVNRLMTKSPAWINADLAYASYCKGQQPSEVEPSYTADAHSSKPEPTADPNPFHDTEEALEVDPVCFYYPADLHSCFFDVDDEAFVVIEPQQAAALKLVTPSVPVGVDEPQQPATPKLLNPAAVPVPAAPAASTAVPRNSSSSSKVSKVSNPSSSSSSSSSKAKVIGRDPSSSKKSSKASAKQSQGAVKASAVQWVQFATLALLALIFSCSMGCLATRYIATAAATSNVTATAAFAFSSSNSSPVVLPFSAPTALTPAAGTYRYSNHTLLFVGAGSAASSKVFATHSTPQQQQCGWEQAPTAAPAAVCPSSLSSMLALCPAGETHCQPKSSSSSNGTLAWWQQTQQLLPQGAVNNVQGSDLTAQRLWTHTQALFAAASSSSSEGVTSTQLSSNGPAVPQPSQQAVSAVGSSPASAHPEQAGGCLKMTTAELQALIGESILTAVAVQVPMLLHPHPWIANNAAAFFMPFVAITALAARC